MKEKIQFTAKVEQADEHTIEAIVERTGIVLPSSHLGIFIAPMTPIEVANQNGVRVSREAMDKFKDTVIQSHINFNHEGAGRVCGSNIDTWIDEETKEQKVAFTFFKGLYPNEYLEALELMSQGKLSVSFELLTDTETVEHLADGTKRLLTLEYTGMGLLMDVAPAYRDAQVEQYANSVKEEKELVFASQILETCNKLIAENKQEGGQTEMKDEEKKVDAEIEEKEAKVTEEAEIKEETSKEETEVKEETKEEASEETTEESSEEKAEESKEEETERASDEDKEEAKLEITTEEKTVVKETIDDMEDKVEVDSETTVTVVRDGEQTSKEVTKQSVEQTFTFAEMEAEVAKQVEAKLAEIDEERVKADKISESKEELKDNQYVAEFTDEDYLDEAKVEVAKIKQENDDLKAKLEDQKPEAKEEASEEKKETEEVKASKTDLDTGFTGKTPEGGLRSVLKSDYNKSKK